MATVGSSKRHLNITSDSTAAATTMTLGGNGVATEAYVGTQITNLIDSSPSALNTLNELAAALGDDASFSTTVTNSIATKLPLAGGTLTGTLTGTYGIFGNNLYVNQGANLTSQALQVNGFIDITDVTGTALRWYNGSTFRGGLGTNAWAMSGSDSDLSMYVSGDNSFFVQTNNVTRAEFDSDGLEVTGNISATNFSGSSSGTNTGDQDLSGYLTSVPSEYLTQTEGDARYVSYDKVDRSVPSTGGWYRLARIGRGGARFAISYTGGNMSPHTYVIDAFKNWNNEATISVEKFGHANYITGFKISRREGTGNSDYYLEAEFTSLSNTHSFQARFQESLGYLNISEIYDVSSGSVLVASTSDDSEIIEELETTAAEGLYLKNMNLDGRLNLYTDSNTTSTTALVLNGTEVEKRTLGSLAFDSTTLGTAAAAATGDFATAAQGTKADAALPKAGGTLTGGLTGTTATFSGLVFTKIYKTISVSIANSYVRIAEIDDTGGQISSTVRVTLTAHGSSHVTTCNAIISVGHSQDILIQSDNLDYTTLTLKVESNSNGQWTLSAKSNSANSTAYKIDIQGLSNNISITPTPTTSQSGTTLEHTTNFGTNITGVTTNTPSSGGLKHQFGGKMFFNNVDSNTDSTTALVLDGNEVEKRTLGSNAFNSTAYITSQRAISSTPTDGATTTAISSGWAFDNVKTAVPANAVFTDTVNTFDGAYSSLTGTPTIPSGNAIIDWTADQGTTNIHSGNYSNTQLSQQEVLGMLTAGDNITITTDGEISATDTDTVYTHPTTAGNKHIPSGGAAGEFLRYSSSGTAVWATPSYTTNTNTTYSAGTGLDLTSTTFSVEPDLRDGITHIGKDSNNYIQFDPTNGRIDFYTGGEFVARLESDGDLHVKGDVIAYSDIFS